MARSSSTLTGLWWLFLLSFWPQGAGGSDAHPGLVSAVNATLPGTSWQPCRTHFMTNLLAKVDNSDRAFVATLVRTIFLQPDARAAWNRLWVVVEQLEPRFPEVPSCSRPLPLTCLLSPPSPET